MSEPWRISALSCTRPSHHSTSRNHTSWLALARRLVHLDYANRYPSEVSAVIGIDSTVPTAQFEKEAAANGGGINITGILSTIGFVRTVVWVAPSVVDPKSDDYTPSEAERMRQMTS